MAKKKTDLSGIKEIPLEPPTGDFIMKHAKGVAGVDGQYYHYAEVCSLIRRAKIEAKIEELEKHVEHPRKPGYRRHDIIDKIKELKSQLK